jgi:hypothetical protein
MLVKDDIITVLFKDFHRPLKALSATALLVVASSRFAFALIAAMNLVFVYMFALLLAESLKRLKVSRQFDAKIVLFPQKNRKIVNVFLVNFAGCIFFFAYYCIAPLLAMETLFITLFVPIFAYSENILEKHSALSPFLAAKNCFFESLYLSISIMVVALIREPLGYAALSLPGGSGGIIELFNKEGRFPFAVEIVSLSAGAFLLVGFIMVLFRVLDRRKAERRGPKQEWQGPSRRGTSRERRKP